MQALLDQPTSPQALEVLTRWMVAQALGPVDEGVNFTGRRFGAYLVHERIAVGGMGEVYDLEEMNRPRSRAIWYFGAEGGTRTPTVLLPPAPQAG